MGQERLRWLFVVMVGLVCVDVVEGEAGVSVCLE